MKKGNQPANLRKGNYEAILDSLYRNKSMTVSDLYSKTGISKTTILKLLAIMQEDEIVVQDGKVTESDELGRKPVMYKVNENYKYIISLVLDVHSCFVRIMNFNYDILADEEYEYDSERDYEELLNLAVKTMKKNVALTNIPSDKIEYIVISGAGIIKQRQGIISIPLGHWEKEINIVNDLKNKLQWDIKILLGNVSHFSGFGEIANNFSLEEKRLATIFFWKDHCGGALIDKGKLVEGSNNLIGEIGYINMPVRSEEQTYQHTAERFANLIGATGTLTYAYHIGAQYKTSLLTDKINSYTLCIDDIFSALRENDPLALKIIERNAYYFAMLIQNIIIIFDPSHIILQGFYHKANEKLIDFIYKYLDEMLLPDYNVREKIQITLSEIKHNFNFHIGANLYAVKKILKAYNHPSK